MWRVAALGLALSLVACGGKRDERNINTLPQNDELYSEMWTLASLTDELDRLMKQPEVDNGAAVALLEKMESNVNSLRSKKERRAHPMIDDNIETFYQEVTAARVGAQANPPNYFFAGKVSGACVYCHDPSGGIRRK